MDELLTTTACTLPTAERPFRLAEFEALFTESVRHVARVSDVKVRMQLVGSPGLHNRVRDLAQRETSCCSFFTFGIDGDDNGLTLDVAVPAAHREMLDGLATRAAALSA